MKELTRCSQCSNAAVRPPFGFAGGECTYYCTDQRMPVDPDDGCTFGVPGKPRHARCSCDVDIGGDAAVRGC